MHACSGVSEMFRTLRGYHMFCVQDGAMTPPLAMTVGETLMQATIRGTLDPQKSYQSTCRSKMHSTKQKVRVRSHSPSF